MALALGKTIAELKSVLTYPEFLDWKAFYKDFPFDDFNRYHRPASISGSNQKFVKIQDALDWLQRPQVSDELSDADISVMRVLGGLKD